MRLVLLALVCLVPLPALAQVAAGPDPVDRAVVATIRPGFDQLAEEAASLAMNLEGLCAAPSDTALVRAQNQFRSVVTAWSRVEYFRIGPLLENNRAERLLFWPDRKGIALKQVQSALAEADETATSLDTLRGKSIALQGLTTLEYLLFGTGAEALAGGAEYRCRFALAVGEAISSTAGELAAAWDDPEGISRRLMEPSAANADFRTEREALEALLGIIAHGIEAIRDTRLLPVVGEGDAAPKPKSALFWRSGMAIPALAANFDGLRDLFERSGFWVGAGVEAQNTADSVAFEFKNADRAFALLTAPIDVAVDDPHQLQALKYLVILTQSLGEMVGERLAAALGLSVGFSSLDGD